MEKRHNPNFHKRLRRGTGPKSWSELPLDLLTLVFERLSFVNFKRAESVCSSWHSASRQSVSKIDQVPWLILFPRDSNNNTCTLFNPEEKDKLYKTEDLGVEFAKSLCKATCGCWVLMQDPRSNLYILNLFTRERINLPNVESQLGMIKIERTIDGQFKVSADYKTYNEGIAMRTPVLWIDEKTKDYIVICGLGRWCVVYSKKGDKCWNQIPEMVDCHHLVYKDHKLYFSSYVKNDFRIFDFSKKIPQRIFKDLIIMHGLALESSRGKPGSPYRIVNTRFVVTVTGDVLKVDRITEIKTRICTFFDVHKIYSSGSFEKYENVESLGDEAMLLDLGITVPANDIEGLQRNCIYFNGSHGRIINDKLIYNLETQKMDPVHKFEFSLLQLYRARWFLPSNTQT